MLLPNNAKLRAIEWFHNETLEEPLSCGNRDHDPLYPRETSSGTIYLECLQCDHIQFHEPIEAYDKYCSLFGMNYEERK